MTNKNVEYIYTRKRKIVIGSMIGLLVLLSGLLIYTAINKVIINSNNSIVLSDPLSETSEAIDTVDNLATDSGNYEEIEPTDVADNTPEATPEKEEDILNAAFRDKFTSGEVITTENSYQSENINITVDKITENDVTYFVADIYIKDLLNFRTAFADGEYGYGRKDSIQNIAGENNAIVAITGDFYSFQPTGIVLRNGEIYRDTLWGDVLVMYNDGSMETIAETEFDINNILWKGLYQAWSFGPMLLDEGQPMTSFNSKKQIYSKNPRSAVGYYEPGHYCFVTVDGRGKNDSVGMTLKELSILFFELGCTSAYNLDGGGSAKMMFMDEMINKSSSSKREISDILYLTEIVEE